MDLRFRILTLLRFWSPGAKPLVAIGTNLHEPRHEALSLNADRPGIGEVGDGRTRG